MFLHGSRSSFCDSRTNSYFDRPSDYITRHRSDNRHASTTGSTMAMTRKRPRVDSSYHLDTRTPRASTSAPDLDASTSSFGIASPSPLTNTDYRLFGGLDTPGTWSELREERAGIEDEERDHRLNRYTQQSQALQKAHNEADPMASSTTLSGWHIRRTAWALTGGLAGKIFSFCWNTTFRGFQAGGGQAYMVNNDKSTDFAQDGDRSPSITSPGFDPNPSGDYFQGMQPVRNMNNQGYDHHQTPVRYQRSQPSEDSIVKNSWVFVETTPGSPEAHSPVHKRSRASVAGSMHTHIQQPTQTSSRTYTASFASPRSRTTSFTSRSCNNYNNFNTSTASAPTGRISPLGLAPKSKRPRVSMGTAYTSPTRRQSTYISNVQQQSPMSPEIETYQRKRRKEARKHDESLGRMNATLQDMIREAQQALGSKIEIVEDYDMGGDMADDLDEGYFGEELK